MTRIGRLPRLLLAVLCLLPLLLLTPTGPNAEAQEREDPTALAALEKALVEATRELTALQGETARERTARERAERGLADLQEFIRKELGPAVGFRTGRARPELGNDCPDPRRIRTRVSSLLARIPEMHVIFPARAHQVSKDGGIVVKEIDDQVKVVYLDPELAAGIADQSLEDCLETMRSVWRRTFTDLHKMLEAHARAEMESEARRLQLAQKQKELEEVARRGMEDISSLRNEVAKLQDRCRRREFEFEELAKKFEDQQARTAKLETENAKLAEVNKKLETALRLLKEDR